MEQQLQQLSVDFPFHNIKRLLRKQGIEIPLSGGDCFQLANLTAILYNGKVIPARYNKSNDYHWLAELPSGYYIDMTCKSLLYNKESKEFGKLHSVGVETNYFEQRPSVLDNILLIRKYLPSGKYMEITGRECLLDGVVKEFKDFEFEQMLPLFFNLPLPVVEILKPFIYTDKPKNIE